MNRKIPNFFVVGAPKCGTTSLYFYFSQHPEIYLSPIKEPVYFAKDMVEMHNKCNPLNPYFEPEGYFKQKKLSFVHIAYLTGLDHYLELFREVKGEKAIGEMAVLNLFSRVAAKEIFKFNPEAKIIIILRDPVERTFSHFNAELRDGRVIDNNFIKYVIEDFKKGDEDCKHNFIKVSLYYEQVRRYLDVFPEENVKIILFNDLKRDVEKACKELFEFLGVSSDVEIDFEGKRNQSLTPKFPRVNLFVRRFKRRFNYLFPRGIPPFIKNVYNFIMMEKEKPVLSPEERKFLLPFFKEDILKTQDLIGRDLSQWLKVE